MAKKTNSENNPIYQLKITLRGSKPPIWRRVLVPGKFSLDDLHMVIQYAMGWTGSHLHQFNINGRYYGVPSDDYWEKMYDGSHYLLKDMVPQENSKFIYEYDFGDSWEHVILVEKILPSEAGKTYPVCIKGKRACPPEDVGGIWGYEEFLLAIDDPEDEEHDSYLEWVGGEFDPEECNLEDINMDLRRIK